MVIVDAEPTIMAVFAVALIGRRKTVLPLLFAISLAAAINMWQVIPGLEEWADGFLPRTLGHTAIRYAGNTLVAVLGIWGLVRLLGPGSSRERMARAAERRRDFLGAAEMYLEDGSHRRALELFKKARSWRRAADLAVRLRLDQEAASLMRRAGGRDLAEAARLYRSIGDRDSAI